MLQSAASAYLPLLVLILLGVWALVAMVTGRGEQSVSASRLSKCTFALLTVTPCAEEILRDYKHEGLSDRVSQASTAAAYALAFAALLWTIQRGRLKQVPLLSKVLILYAGVLVASAILNHSLSRVSLVYGGAVLAAGLPIDRLENRVQLLRACFRFVTFSSVALLLLGVQGAIFTDNGRELAGIGQLSGATPHPNVLGPVAGFALLVELAPGKRKPSVTAIAAALACSLFAQSRSGWICSILVLLFFGLHKLRSRRVMFISFGLLSVLAANPAVLRAGEGNAPASAGSLTDGRAEIWSVVWNIFLHHPWIGLGPQVFGVDFRDSGSFRLASATGQAHNQLLETLAETGVIGGLVLIALVVLSLWSAVRAERHVRWVPIAACSLLIAYFVSESPLRANMTTQTLLVLSVVALCNVCPSSLTRTLPRNKAMGLAGPPSIY